MGTVDPGMLSPRRRGLAAIAVLIVAALSACGRVPTASPKDPNTPTPGRTGTGTGTVRGTVTARLSPGALDLSTVLIHSVTNYELQSASGPLDLEQAVALGRDATRERAALTTNRFTRGYANILQSDTNSIVASVYEFHAASGAKAFADYTIKDAVTYDSGTLFKLSKLPNAVGVKYTEQGTSALYVIAVYLAVGPRLYAIAIGGSQPNANERDAETLALVEAKLAR